MTVWNAILLGLVQGLAEFFPISSSGHISIINNLFNMSTSSNGHPLFSALLHLATLGAVLIVYWQDVSQMFFELLSFANLGPLAGQPRTRYPAARQFIMIVVATLPLFIILPIYGQVDKLQDQNAFVGVTLILSGFILFVSDRMTAGKKSEKSMTFLDAILIGLCQCVATIPGLSRSGTTITAGLATGLRRDFALRFSFLLSVPAVFGAAILSIAEAVRQGVDWACVPAYLVGMVVALLVGVGAINLMKYICAKGKFGGFAYYCWVVGVLGIILSMIF